jgi:nucleoside-diphosphate-sugar epimerase
MNILVLGGGGYVGTLLCDELSKEKNYFIKIIDTFWFKNKLKRNKKLKIIKKDIRNLKSSDFKGIDSIIHLANIANDPAVELNEALSWDVNVLATFKIINFAIKNHVKKFIFASSGSVYGLKKEKKVTEDLELVPISVYNKTKMIAERILMSFRDKINIYCIRPATICGYSPRMRFDLSVNMLTLQALKKKQITVFGGDQVRPNIHINDMISVYKFFLKKKINSGFYNAGFENMKIIEIAKKIKKITKAKIKIVKSNDPRSYRQDSSKLINLGFYPKYSVDDAINELTNIYKKGLLNDEESNYTVKWMKKLKIK